MNNKDFTVDDVSDSAYEQITMEMGFQHPILCRLNKDKGIDNIEIEFFFDHYVPNHQPKYPFPLDDFIGLLNEVKAALIAA